MIYAWIENGRVMNRIELDAPLKGFENAVPMNDIPAQTGDSYRDGAFYREGERLLRPIEQALAQVDELKNKVTEVLSHVSGEWL